MSEELKNYQQYMESVFSSLFKPDEEVAVRRKELMTNLAIPNMFRNEYYIFYTILREYPKVAINAEFLELFLISNQATFRNHPCVNIPSYQIGDNDPFAEFIQSCVQVFEQCAKKEIAPAEYYRACEMMKMAYVNNESISLLETCATIITEGVQKRGKTMSGYTDARKHMIQNFSRLDMLTEKTERKGNIVLSEMAEEDEDDTQVKRITTFGIDALDEAIGGIYEGDMVSLLAPPKGGKTRITTYFLHHAVISGVNVAMLPAENGAKGWSALLRARHFHWYYNRNQTDVKQKRILTADMIRKGDLSPELKALEQASWNDLRNNPTYGQIAIIDEDLMSETIIQVIDDAVKLIDAQLICIDYLQLIGSENANTHKAQRIGEAYQKILQYLKRKRIAGIFPAQLKQTVLADLQKLSKDELSTVELRDAAGETSEVIRTPDVNILVYGTVESIRNGSMTLVSIPSRNSAPFDPIDLFVDAGTCTFASLKR